MQQGYLLDPDIWLLCYHAIIMDGSSSSSYGVVGLYEQLNPLYSVCVY